MNGDFQFSQVEQSTGFLLWQLTNLWQREIRKSLEEFDLTHSQFVVLACIDWLASSGDSPTQVAISRLSKIDPMTTSTIVRTLEKRGLIGRTGDAKDTRAKTVRLSDSGQAVARQAIARVENFDQRFFGPLQAKRDEFNANLIKLSQMEGLNSSDQTL